MTVDKTLYTNDSIESKNPREFVRLKPGVYCGDTTYCTQLVVELFSNSLDEHNLGHGDVIEITVNDDGWITVQDYAQGFPVGVYREDGKTVLEAAFSVLNTSGKYREDGVYEGTSLGAYGIGSKLVTYLSEKTIVTTTSGNKTEKLIFEDGLLVNREVFEGMKRPGSGTTVTFKPDAQFFTHAEPDIKALENLFNDICCLCPRLTVKLNDKTFYHPNGITELVSQYINQQTELVNRRFTIKKKDGKRSLDLALSYTSGSAAQIVPYVNYGLTEQGPHISTIKSIITKVFNAYAKENSLLKKNEAALDGTSLQEGLVLVFNLINPDVKYDSQVKTRLTNTDFVPFLNENVGKALRAWMDNNPNDAKEIIEKAVVARRAAEAAKKAREAVKNNAKKTKAEKVFKLPTKLTDAWSKNRSECELLVCEGLSAASGLVAARNGEYQAVYGVRGKMLSVLKSTPSAILKNQEINNLIQALGLDCNEKTAKLKYDVGKLRYGKIIACADGDSDGQAIENLLFNILWYLCPELIINGHVYSAEPPLFRITTKKQEYVYLKDQRALDEYKKSNEKNIASINRAKGLGEQDASELAYCLLDPSTRNIKQLVVEDIQMTNKLFNDLYGKDVEPRVEFLLKHAEEARVD